MKLKSVFTVALLAFVAASVVYVIANGARTQVEGTEERGGAAVPAEAVATPTTSDDAEKSECRVVVYYFHGTARCPTCRSIEQYAHEALKTGFPEALRSGALEWRAVNVEGPEHQHFIDDYQLSTKSLILVEMDGETQVRWKNLDQIWVLVGTKSAFISYVQEETRAYLEEN
jgi:hypothetical protein